MLLRLVAIAAGTLALVMPTLAVAQGNNQHQKSGSKPPASGGRPPAGVAGKPAFRQGGTPGGARTFVQPHGGPQRAVIGPRPGLAGPGGHQFTWHGREFHRVHLAPFAYPSGWRCLTLGGRRGAATAVSVAGLLLCRLGHAWPRSPAAGLPMGAIWARSSSGECHDRRGH